MYQKSAAIYDTVAANRRDYPCEAEQLHQLIQATKRTPGNHLLDVACGTGAYWPYLLPHYHVTGIDLSADMLTIAHQRAPNVPLHRGDLVELNLGQQFDVVICLGSAIGYARTLPNMRQAILSMARHLTDGGVVIIEPWFTPDVWENGRLTADLTDEPQLKVARVLVSGLDESGTISTLDMHHLIATPQGVDSFVERHELGLFTHAEYLAALQAADLAVSHDPVGLIGRGLYVGVRREKK